MAAIDAISFQHKTVDLYRRYIGLPFCYEL